MGLTTKDKLDFYLTELKKPNLSEIFRTHYKRKFDEEVEADTLTKAEKNDYKNRLKRIEHSYETVVV